MRLWSTQPVLLKTPQDYKRQVSWAVRPTKRAVMERTGGTFAAVVVPKHAAVRMTELSSWLPYIIHKAKYKLKGDFWSHYTFPLRPWYCCFVPTKKLHKHTPIMTSTIHFQDKNQTKTPCPLLWIFFRLSFSLEDSRLWRPVLLCLFIFNLPPPPLSTYRLPKSLIQYMKTGKINFKIKAPVKQTNQTMSGHGIDS